MESYPTINECINSKKNAALTKYISTNYVNKITQQQKTANSKQAQILYTRKLARKLKSDGINAVVCANCPGLVNTKISDGMMSWKRMIFTTAGWFLGKALERLLGWI